MRVSHAQRVTHENPVFVIPIKKLALFWRNTYTTKTLNILRKENSALLVVFRCS